MSEKSKNKIYFILSSFIILGLLVPFGAQFVLPFFFPENKIAGAEVWNQYVSIILGIVATIMSVVSLVLGFKSEEQAYETERRTRDTLHHIESRIEVITLKQDQLQSSLARDYSESAKAVSVNLASGISKPDDETVS